MRLLFCIWLLLIGLFLLAASSDKAKSSSQDSIRELGWYLFFDKALSGTGEISCSTCHNPTLAFTDGYRRSFNAYAEPLRHNAPSLLNLDDNSVFNWKSSKVNTLHAQLQGPLANHDPVEMEFYENLDLILSRLGQKEYLQVLMPEWHLMDKCEQVDLIQDALVVYVDGLSSRNSEFDRYVNDDNKDIYNLKGYNEFLDFSCIDCHAGRDFDKDENDALKINLNFNKNMRVPTLRNVMLTGPYFHDGRVTKIRDVIVEHGYDLSDSEMQKLISFLECLTDTSFYSEKYFYDPLKSDYEM